MDDSTVPGITVTDATTDLLMVNRQKGIRFLEQISIFKNSFLTLFKNSLKKGFHSNSSGNLVLVDSRQFTKVYSTELKGPSK